MRSSRIGYVNVDAVRTKIVLPERERRASRQNKKQNHDVIFMNEKRCDMDCR